MCGLRYNSCRCLVGSDSVRQSLSALCASSLEHLSSVSGSHSLSEAVLNLSLTLLRLVCSKHFDTSFKSRLPGEPRQDHGLIQTISRPDSPDPDMTLKLHNNTYYYTRITPGLSRAFRKKTPKFKKFTICSPFEDPRITPLPSFSTPPGRTRRVSQKKSLRSAKSSYCHLIFDGFYAIILFDIFI